MSVSANIVPSDEAGPDDEPEAQVRELFFSKPLSDDVRKSVKISPFDPNIMLLAKHATVNPDGTFSVKLRQEYDFDTNQYVDKTPHLTEAFEKIRELAGGFDLNDDFYSRHLRFSYDGDIGGELLKEQPKPERPELNFSNMRESRESMRKVEEFKEEMKEYTQREQYRDNARNELLTRTREYLQNNPDFHRLNARGNEYVRQSYRIRESAKELEPVVASYLLKSSDPEEIPYEDFPAFNTQKNKHHENCLINELIERYAGKSLAKSTIIEDFKKEGTTIEDFAHWCTNRGIPVSIFDITGKELLNVEISRNKARRVGCSIIAHNGHAYFYKNNKLRGHPHIDTSSESQVIQHKDKNENLDKIHELIQELGKTDVGTNFTFKAEKFTIASLMWCKASHVASGIDMDKAYYNSFMGTDDQQKIGIFTIQDDIMPYLDEKLTNECIYFVDKNTINAWQTSDVPHLNARKNSILMGFEAIYLQKMGYPLTITHVKKPSYTKPAKYYKDKVNKLNFMELEKNGAKGLFAFYNGNLGRRTAGGQPTIVNNVDETDKMFLNVIHDQLTALVQKTPNKELNEIQCENCMILNQECYCQDEEETKYVCSLAKKERYLYNNTLNLYWHTVGMCNLRIMEKVDQLKHLWSNIVRIWVDSIEFNTCENVSCDGWKSIKIKEKSRLLSNFIQYVDPNSVICEIIKEVNDFLENATVYTGAPGTGKTYTVQEYHTVDVATTFTNRCARNMVAYDENDRKITGKTLHTALRLMKPEDRNNVQFHLRNKTLWVDEISMVAPFIWNEVFTMGLHLEQLILTGDPHQCSPIKMEGDKIVSDCIKYKSIFMSAIINMSTKLTKDYRNDEYLVELRDKIEQLEFQSVDMALTKLHNIFKDTPKATKEHLLTCDNHIVCSRQTADALNSAILAERKLRFDIDEISSGVRVESTESLKKLNVSKREMFTIIGGNNANCVLVGIATEKTIIVEKAQLLKYFVPCFAITAMSSQGLTIKGKTCIWEYAGMACVDTRLLYTAITRACKLQDLYVHARVIPEIKRIPPKSLTAVVQGMEDCLDAYAVDDGFDFDEYVELNK